MSVHINDQVIGPRQDVQCGPAALTPRCFEARKSDCGAGVTNRLWSTHVIGADMPTRVDQMLARAGIPTAAAASS
jgi:hypothetical protein